MTEHHGELGHQLAYPTEFRDGSSIMGLFVVPTSAARSRLAGTGFTPAEIAPGRTVLSLACVHYTDTDCGNYDEVAMALFVNSPGYLRTLRRIASGSIGAHSWRLAVTSEASRRCGLEMWGFPKTLEDLRWEVSGGTASMSWHDGDVEVLRFSVPATGSRTPATISPPVYSLMDGKPHIGFLTQRSSGVGYHRRGVSLSLGDHPVAHELREIGLPRAPLVGVWNDHLHFTMSAPRPLD